MIRCLRHKGAPRNPLSARPNRLRVRGPSPRGLTLDDAREKAATFLAYAIGRGASFRRAADANLEELVTAAQAEAGDDTVAMNEIIHRFEPKARGLAAFITRDYHLQQDVANASRWGVVKGVRAHTPGTLGVGAYIAMTMRGEAYRAVGRVTAEHEVVKSAESPIWCGERHLIEDQFVVDSDLGLLAQDLTTEQRGLVLKRYIRGDGITDLAREAGTSVSAMSQRFKTVHKAVVATIALRSLEIR